MKKKVAIVLFNLGGPDNLESVKPFLFNLFYDKAIINLINPFRFIIATLISSLRNKKSQGIYAQMGGKSPILEETQKQATAIEMALKPLVGDVEFKIFISMRYWKPFSSDTIPEVIDYNPHEMILVPLYPQFSTTTTASSLDDFHHQIKSYDYKGAIKSLGCYFLQDSFIKSHVDLIRQTLEKVKDDNYKILFSAHGLPISIIKKGDPYEWQICETVKKIAGIINLKKEQYQITYQSRVGPVKWLEPNTEHVIKDLAMQGKNIVVVPISFVSEHSETLVELDIEYKEIADSYKINYYRVPALADHEDFISCITTNIINLIASEDKTLTSDQFKRLCPTNFSKCICKG